jgi:hypothetical protein
LEWSWQQSKDAKYAVRENKCKARYFAAQNACLAAMTEPDADALAVNDLARKYLDLWLEHWASCLAAPETAAAMARLFALLGGPNAGTGFAGFDAAAGRPGAWNEPPAFRTAPNDGDRRADELEKRIAALERRLAERESGSIDAAKPAVARPARKPRRRTGAF